MHDCMQVGHALEPCGALEARGARGREEERERARKRERERDRQTDRHRHRHKHRHKDKHAWIQVGHTFEPCCALEAGGAKGFPECGYMIDFGMYAQPEHV